nr:hypothetical protein CFP56_36316 [Quercus suber]
MNVEANQYATPGQPDTTRAIIQHSCPSRPESCQAGEVGAAHRHKAVRPSGRSCACRTRRARGGCLSVTTSAAVELPHSQKIAARHRVFAISATATTGDVGALDSRWQRHALIVLDNADDVAFLLEPPTSVSQSARRRWDYLPSCEHGSTIITSRSKSAALELVYGDDIVEVSPMSEQEAETLPGGGIHSGAKTAKLRTAVSFEHIDRTQRSAAELLSFMSFCDRVALPEILPRTYVGTDDQHKAVQMEEDIILLRSFSFVSSTHYAQKWDMHRLVQDAMQAWLEDHDGRLDEVQSQSVLLGRGEADDEGYKHKQPCTSRRLLGEEHPSTLDDLSSLAEIFKVQGRLEEAEESRAKVTQMMKRQLGEKHDLTLRTVDSLAETYRAQRRWQMSGCDISTSRSVARGRGATGEGTRDDREGTWGEASNELTGMSILALAYFGQERKPEAEGPQLKLIEMMNEVLREIHHITLISTSILASRYRKRGRWKNADISQAIVLQGYKELYGLQHANTRAAAAKLANIQHKVPLCTCKHH